MFQIGTDDNDFSIGLKAITKSRTVMLVYSIAELLQTIGTDQFIVIPIIGKFHLRPHIIKLYGKELFLHL